MEGQEVKKGATLLFNMSLSTTIIVVMSPLNPTIYFSRSMCFSKAMTEMEVEEAMAKEE